MSIKSPICVSRSNDKYSKLLSKGMPDDFVKRKMIFDGIKQRDVDTFFTNLEKHSSYTCYSDKPTHFRNSASSKYLSNSSTKTDRYSMNVKTRQLVDPTRNRAYSTYYTVKNVGSINTLTNEDNQSLTGEYATPYSKPAAKDELIDLKHELCKHQRPSLLKQFNENRNSLHESKILENTLEDGNSGQYTMEYRKVNVKADSPTFDKLADTSHCEVFDDSRSIRTFSVVSNATTATSSTPKLKTKRRGLLTRIIDLFRVKNKTKIVNRSSESSLNKSCRTSSSSTCESVSTNNSGLADNQCAGIFYEDMASSASVSCHAQKQNISTKENDTRRDKKLIGLRLISSTKNIPNFCGLSCISLKKSSHSTIQSSFALHGSNENNQDSMYYLTIYSSSKDNGFNEQFAVRNLISGNGEKGAKSLSILTDGETITSEEMYYVNTSQKTIKATSDDSSPTKSHTSSKTDRFVPSRQASMRFSCKIENPLDFHQSLSNKGSKNPYARGGAGHRSTKFSNNLQLSVDRLNTETLILSG